jgi:hypothetical protein
VSPFVLSTLSLSGTLSRQNTVQLADGGVAFVGRDVGEAGSISFECHIIGSSTDDCVDLVDDIMAAFGPASDNRELTLTMGTRSKVYRGRPLSCVPVLDGSQYGAARCSFTVVRSPLVRVDDEVGDGRCRIPVGWHDDPVDDPADHHRLRVVR